MKAKPYVGIAGIKTESEAKQILSEFEKAGFCNKSAYIACLGYHCSANRLKDKSSLGRFSPAANDLPKLSEIAQNYALPMIHYYTQNKPGLLEEILDVFSIGNMYENSYCRALQLNMDWPMPEQIHKIKANLPELKIVLQIPKRAAEGLDISTIAKRSGEYDCLVDYALIDYSGGKGVDLDVSQYLGILSALSQSMPNTTLGIAGGLDGENVKPISAKIKSEYCQPFFIDAQGKLRTEAQDSICLDKASRYIQAGKEAFGI